MPADFLIEEALRGVEQVQRVSMFEEEGLIHLWITEAEPALLEVLAERIEDLGYTMLDSHLAAQPL